MGIYQYLALDIQWSSHVWTVGLYGIWVDTSRNSILSQRGRHLGRWRTIVDLGQPIERDLGSELDGYSDQELEEELKVCPPIKYEMHFDGTVVDEVTLSSTSVSRRKETLKAPIVDSLC
jgi:hypothetical protein